MRRLNAGDESGEEKRLKVGVILNPIAGGGWLRRQLPDIEAVLTRHFGSFVLRETELSGDAVRLAREFAVEEFDLVIAAGGDGTGSEVADGLLSYQEETGKAAPALGIVPSGTGIDFARGLGLTTDYEATLARIAAAPVRDIDVGRVSFVDDEGRLHSRHFLNISSAGLSGATTRAINRDKKKGRMSAKALFFWHTVVQFLRYKIQTVRVKVDGTEPFEARVALVAVCNGRFFGGGMMIAPDAALDDGEFDIVVVRASGKAGLIRDLRLVYGGRHRNHHAITIQRGKSVNMEPVVGGPENAALVEVDGEPIGRIPARFELLPKALRLKS